VNGSINGTSFYNNGINFENIYLKIINAEDIYINKSSAYNLYGSWINTGIRDGTNATIYTSNITNYTVGINTSITGSFQLNVNGRSYINFMHGDGYNISNLNFNNINPSTLQPFITSNSVDSLYYNKVYIDATYTPNISTSITNGVFSDSRFITITNITNTLLGNGTNSEVINSVASQIAASANFADTFVFTSLKNNPFCNISSNNITGLYTIGLNASNNLVDAFNIGGSIRVSNYIYSSNIIYENNSPLSNVYVSSNVLTSNYLNLYQTINSTKISELNPFNIYPPPMYTQFINNSNIINKSIYGNGLYIFDCSHYLPHYVSNIFNSNNTNWTPSLPISKYIDYQYYFNRNVGSFDYISNDLNNISYYGMYFQLYYSYGFISILKFF
jgi:hypothetical protein